jgi:hypothetical protein
LIVCAVINYAVLIVRFVAFLEVREWLYRMHAKWFRLSPDGFDAMPYGGMAIYKLRGAEVERR